MNEHNKIIHSTAKQILAPQGLFRKGNSRTWIDDNNYYLTIVEFQPNAYLKGSFLNVGIHFLWETTSDLNHILSYNMGGRIHPNQIQFSEYIKNENSFQQNIEIYVKEALKKVIEYRQFQNLDYAKKQLKQQAMHIPLNRQFWTSYHLAMLCFLKGDYEDGRTYFNIFMENLKASFYMDNLYIEWHEQFYNYCMEYLFPCMNTKSEAQNMVFQMINRRRDYFCTKSAFQKMTKNLVS